MRSLTSGKPYANTASFASVRPNQWQENVHIRTLLKPPLKNCRRVSSVFLSQPSRLHRTSRTMSSESHSIGTKNPKFGYLPFSTSGPEECTLTVLAMIPSLCDTIVSIWLTLGRVWPSFDLHITTRALLSLRMSARVQALRSTTSKCADVRRTIQAGVSALQ